MPYPDPGTYESAYFRRPAPGYYYPPPPPYYGQAAQLPPGYAPPPVPYYPPPRQPAANLGGNLLQILLPIITTLPAVKNGQQVAANLQSQLAGLTDPNQIGAPPTAADYNALLQYAKSVKNAVQQSVGNDSSVFAALRQAILFTALSGGLGGQGGQDTTLLIVLLLAFGGGF